MHQFADIQTYTVCRYVYLIIIKLYAKPLVSNADFVENR